MSKQADNRAPFAEQTHSIDKRHAGRTEAFDTPLEIRNLDEAVDAALRAWVHERLGRELGKYAPHIERVDVRFGDENGPKGGIDRACMVHVVLSSLEPVVVEMRAGEDREAFDLAAGRVKRALGRTMAKHGFNTKHKRKQRPPHGALDEDAMAAVAVGKTSKRNTKLNTAGMAYALEDSTTARPSRKSTRRGKNRVKHASELTLRTKAAVHAPQARAARRS